MAGGTVRIPDSVSRSVGAATLDKLLVILESITDSGDGPVGVSALSRRTNLAKSTVHRSLATLHDAELVERTEDGYVMGRRLRQLTKAAYRRDGLYQRILPHLAELYARTRGAVDLAVLCGTDVVYVERISPAAASGSRPPVGARIPAHHTAVGKVLLAFDIDRLDQCMVRGGAGHASAGTGVSLVTELARIRRHGVAIERRGRGASGVVSAAAPVLNRRQQPLAAIAVAGAPPHTHEQWMVEMLRRTARAASASAAEEPAGEAGPGRPALRSS